LDTVSCKHCGAGPPDFHCLWQQDFDVIDVQPPCVRDHRYALNVACAIWAAAIALAGGMLLFGVF
jgi:hypothetical protein